MRLYAGTRDDGQTTVLAITDNLLSYVADSGAIGGVSGHAGAKALAIAEVQRTVCSTFAGDSGQGTWDAECERWT